MKECFLDTNIFLRILTSDEEAKSAACQNLIRRGINKKLRLHTSAIVIAEIVWTLESFYGCSPGEIREKVEMILNTPNLKIENQDLIAEAIALYEDKNIDFIDCYNAIYAREKGMDILYSYDEDFNKVPWITRIEP